MCQCSLHNSANLRQHGVDNVQNMMTTIRHNVHEIVEHIASTCVVTEWHIEKIQGTVDNRYELSNNLIFTDAFTSNNYFSTLSRLLCAMTDEEFTPDLFKDCIIFGPKNCKHIIYHIIIIYFCKLVKTE